MARMFFEGTRLNNIMIKKALDYAKEEVYVHDLFGRD